MVGLPALLVVAKGGCHKKSAPEKSIPGGGSVFVDLKDQLLAVSLNLSNPAAMLRPVWI